MQRLLNSFCAATLIIGLTLLLAGQHIATPSFAQEALQPAEELAESASVAAGDGHTCALTSSNSLKCWGSNAVGQLGIGTLLDQPAPTLVTGINNTATAVVTGARHTCALINDGGVRCWGDNTQGQLGNNSADNQPAPVVVMGLAAPAIALAAGGNHTCAVLNTGALLCWGDNAHGQVNATPGPSALIPAPVANLSEPAISVAAGIDHTCALLQSGAVQCWGDDTFGQLGNGPAPSATSPVAVVNLAPNVLVLAAGAWHTCAATTTGVLQCWGRNGNGQLGDGSIIQQPQPISVATPANGSTPTALSLGRQHTCLIDAAGSVYCWGDNSSGQLGNATTTDSPLPQKVSALAGIAQDIAAGSRHTCALLGDGSLSCWGRNYNGQLGDGEIGRYPLPLDVSGLTNNVDALVTASNTTCARIAGAARSARCWGSNAFGQVGDGTRVDRNAPITVTGLGSGVILLSSDGGHSCATTASQVLCWGNNSNGQLGDGSNIDRLTPVAVSGISGAAVRSIVIGDLHTCVLLFEGKVKCWGNNAYGQLGDGSTTDRNTPVEVKSLGGYPTSVTAGSTHSCARMQVGFVKCWGNNAFGQLGDGTRVDHILAAPVTGFDKSGAASVHASETHTCVRLDGDTGVQCWGNNRFGQLGNNSQVDSLVPVTVAGLSNVSSVSVGRFHNCALSNGEMSCWGDNRYGQLGDGTFVDRLIPTKVKGLGGAVTGLGAGGSQTCALISKAMKCWGNDFSGQVGNSVLPDQYSPISVQDFLEPRPRRTRTPVPGTPVPTITSLPDTPVPIDTTTTPLPSITALPGTGTPVATNTPIPSTLTPATTPTPSPTGQVDPPRRAIVYAPLILRNAPLYFDGPNEAENNDTAATANGPLRLNTDYRAFPDDADDYFRFDLPSDGTLTLSITGHIAENTRNVQLQLRSATDASIQFVFQKPFVIQRSLPAGTYLARVFYAPPGPYSTTAPYTLRVGFQ